ncbi:MAG: hypothetical protein ABI451_08940 [Dokdonella sp.]
MLANDFPQKFHFFSQIATISWDVVVSSLRLAASFLVAILVISCAQRSSPVLLSKPFALCADKLENVSYQIESGIDAQRGFVREGETTIAIDIGLYPDIPLTLRENVRSQPSKFSFYRNVSRTAGAELRLYTYKQFNEYVFVQFMLDRDNTKQIALIDKLGKALHYCQ